MKPPNRQQSGAARDESIVGLRPGPGTGYMPVAREPARFPGPIDPNGATGAAIDSEAVAEAELGTQGEQSVASLLLRSRSVLRCIGWTRTSESSPRPSRDTPRALRSFAHVWGRMVHALTIA